MTRRRRFTEEQKEAILRARAKQKRACARGNHIWWPKHEYEPSDIGIGPPQYWTTNRRYPRPIWDEKTVVCTACNLIGMINKLSPKKQERVRDIFDGFVESTLSLRKRRESEQALKGD